MLLLQLLLLVYVCGVGAGRVYVCAFSLVATAAATIIHHLLATFYR